jgi:hypothetical protein
MSVPRAGLEQLASTALQQWREVGDGGVEGDHIDAQGGIDASRAEDGAPRRCRPCAD